MQATAACMGHPANTLFKSLNRSYPTAPTVVMSNLSRQTSRTIIRVQVLTLLLGLTATLAVVAAIFFLHIRWYWRAAICGGLYGLYIFLQMKVSKILMRSVDEEEY